MLPLCTKHTNEAQSNILKKPAEALTNLITHLNNFNGGNKSHNHDNLPGDKCRDTTYSKSLTGQFIGKS